MQIVIIRQEHKPWGIDGKLYINRQQICDTVEHPSRHLPADDYEIVLHTNPFRHGDGAMALKMGEIIVGKRALPGVVTKSVATYNNLYQRLKKAWQRGSPVRLRIIG